MRYLSLENIISLYSRVIEESGGLAGIRDRAAIESALAQPMMTFAGKELYPSLIEKAGALCYSIIQNHPFVDGNKRIGHAAMEAMLLLNGFEIDCPSREQEQIILRAANSELKREDFISWVKTHTVPIS